MTFRFGTLCSGIEAASEAFLPLGAECAYVSEIEPYPCGVLADRHGAGKPMRMPSPDEASTEKERRVRLAAIKTIDRFPRWANRIPNFGDLTQIDPEELPVVDLLVAGFPCQDFSIAGLRQSLAGSRGNLTLYGVKLIHELVRRGAIRSVLLEQVPDILNTRDNAFGALLGGLVGHDAPIVPPYRGGRWTNAGVAHGPLGTAVWRVEDAQYSGVAQRRERLFLVGDFGNGPDPLAVLFEREGVSRHPPTRGEAGQRASRPASSGAPVGGEPSGRPTDGRSASEVAVPFGCDYRSELGRPLVAPPAGNRSDIETETSVVHVAPTLNARMKGGGGLGTDFDCDGGLVVRGIQHLAPTLQAGGNSTGGDRPPGTSVDTADSLIPVAYAIMPMNSGKDYKARVVDIAQPLMASGPVGGDQGGDQGGDYVVQPIAFNARQDPISGPIVGPIVGPIDTDGATNAIAFSLRGREGGAMPEVEECDLAPALGAADGGSTRPFVCFDETQITSKANYSNPKPGAPSHPLAAGARPPTIASDMAVRRITVVEACRLQGFSDNYTLIDWPTANRKGDEFADQVAYLIGHGYAPEEAAVLAQTPDGPQYKGLGNSKAVPLVRKIGARYAAALERYLAGAGA